MEPKLTQSSKPILIDKNVNLQKNGKMYSVPNVSTDWFYRSLSIR